MILKLNWVRVKGQTRLKVHLKKIILSWKKPKSVYLLKNVGYVIT